MLSNIGWPRGFAVGSAAPLPLCNGVLQEEVGGDLGCSGHPTWESGDLSSSSRLLPPC